MWPFGRDILSQTPRHCDYQSHTSIYFETHKFIQITWKQHEVIIFILQILHLHSMLFQPRFELFVNKSYHAGSEQLTIDVFVIIVAFSLEFEQYHTTKSIILVETSDFYCWMLRLWNSVHICSLIAGVHAAVKLRLSVIDYDTARWLVTQLTCWLTVTKFTKIIESN